MVPPFSLLTLCLAAASPVFAQRAGGFVDGGDTLVSAMMMLVGNEETVYILDKVEGNAVQINGHPAFGSAWDIKSHKATTMDIITNAFCSSGMHLPNGSFVTFGGNGIVGPNGDTTVENNPYGALDGGRGIRVLNPCKSGEDFLSAKCQWYDNPAVLSMQKRRWYSTAEATGDGSIVLIGGFVNGGYVNRNFPNVDPATSNGQSEPTYEFYPSRNTAPLVMQFMIKTSGLNSYAHAFLMPSGKMFVQANISTILWDYNANIETPLPDMPGNIARVYPASGAVAMLPLTPKNNYVPTVLFCGGSDMPADGYGDFGHPAFNTWEYPASTDCQRITPEPTDGTAPAYVKDDNMLEGRTMGQFIILPTGKLLVINGGTHGTAGYSTGTGQITDLGKMPYGMSLASGPVFRPAIYDPEAPVGSRWSNAGLFDSPIPRLYHSSALLLPDGSVIVAGSNPNGNVNLTAMFPTTYKAEIFYPTYFSAKTRPTPTGIPTTISYGGDPFDITLPASSYSGSSNDAADNTTVVLIRPGFTTHAMNMGQRFLQLSNTYTVNNDGTIVLHVAQAPPNPNLLSPGPVFLYVVVQGIPSIGKSVIVGSGQIGPQPTAPASVLPESVRSTNGSGTGEGGSKPTPPPGNKGGSKTSTGTVIGAIVGGLAVLGVLGGIIGIIVARRRNAAKKLPPKAAWGTSATGTYSSTGSGFGETSDASALMPLRRDDSSAWRSTVSFNPYLDERPSNSSVDFDPYSTRTPTTHSSVPQSPRY